MTLRVRRDHVDHIITQAREEAPNECCGMMGGRGEVVEEVFPGRNKDQSPKTYYMDPEDQFNADREIEKRGWELVGIYHSHPHTDAYPSKTDVARALYPDARYVIVSLRDPETPRLRAFRIVDGRITEEEVVIS